MEKDQSLQFMDALTLAELALFEQATGRALSELDDADPVSLVPALAVMAARRLGSELDVQLAANLTMEETQEIFAAASATTPQRPDEINALLAVVRGKSRENS